jgi:hypothetical protein
MPGYYQRQTCLNGHIISNSVGTPHGNAHMQPFCGECGAQTIVDCPSCHQPQRGNLRDVLASGESYPDSYCWNCGTPYPWTERHLAAATELVAEDDLLSSQEKELLNSTFADMTSENPRTTLAATRFKKLAAKAGKGLGEAIQRTLVDVLSETAKKIMLGH